MNKKFLISVVVMFVLSMGSGLSGARGAAESSLHSAAGPVSHTRRMLEAYFPFMLLAHVLIAFGFVWIYQRGKEDKPFLAQGIRFGLAVAVLMTIPMYLIYYAVQPMPSALVYKQIVFDTLGVLLMGIVVAWLNK